MNEILNEWLPGVAVMANVHPLVVHFPIALYTSFLLTDLISVVTRSESLRHTGTWILYLGTLGAGGAVAAGFHAADTVEHGEEVHAIMESHEDYGLLVLALGLLLSSWRAVTRGRSSAFGRWVQLLLGFTLVSVMTLGVDLGGLMVYRHAVAVARSAECAATAEVVPPMTEGEGAAAVPEAKPGSAEPRKDAQPGHPHGHNHKHHKHKH